MAKNHQRGCQNKKAAYLGGILECYLTKNAR